MRIVEKDGIKVLKFEELEKYPSIEHCITTRIGGVSEGPYESLNMGLLTEEDQVEPTRENFRRVTSSFFGKTNDDVVRSDQVHGIKIQKVTSEDRGKGLMRERDFEEVDGFVTDEPGIILATAYADCTPLLFYDPEKQVIASVHSGWKGTLQRIGKEAVRIMNEDYGCSKDDIIAGIGPTIGPDRFEVGEEVYVQFRDEFERMDKILSGKKGDKYYLNLWEANREILEEAGLNPKNILIDDHCTYKNEDMFFSHRRDKGLTGRMAALIMLK